MKTRDKVGVHVDPTLIEFTYVHETDWTFMINNFYWYYKVTKANINTFNDKVLEVATLKVNHKHELKSILNAWYKSNIHIVYMNAINPGYPKYIKVILEGSTLNSTRFIAQRYNLTEAYAYYESGIEHWGFISFNNNNNVSHLIKDLSYYGKVSNLRLKRLNLEGIIGTSFLNADLFLSPNEYRILKSAFDKGFFDIPKKVDLDDLAKELNLNKSTINRYIRSSIYKILKIILKNLYGEEFTRDNLIKQDEMKW